MEALFSIYLIDKDMIISENISFTNETSNTDIMNYIMEKVVDKVSDWIQPSFAQLEKYKNYDTYKGDGYHVLIYEKSNPPIWAGYVQSLMLEGVNNQNFESIKNSSLSYLTLYSVGPNIFATTGGHASAYIEEFIVKKFGLILLSKLIKEGDPILKKIREANFSGNRYSIQLANRTNTGFSTEKDYTKIFNEVESTLNDEILKDLGIDIPKDRNRSAVSSDAFRVQTKLSKSKLLILLENINKIMENDSNFSLGSFAPIDQVRMRKQIVDQKFVEKIIDDDTFKIEEIHIVGQNPFEYLSATNYKLEIDGKIVISRSERITFENILSIFNEKDHEGGKYNKASVNRMLKEWSISAFKDDYVVSDKIPLINMIETSLEINYSEEENNIGEVEVFLLDGQWYVLDKNYIHFVEELFKKNLLDGIEWQKENKFFENIEFYKSLDKLKVEYPNKFKNLSESTFNSFHKNNIKNKYKIISADQTYVNRIEICDFIYFDEENIYFIHNKRHFRGDMIRDITNQLNASMRMVQNISEEEINEYYDSLIRSNDPIINSTNFSLNVFKDHFKKNKIFVCCIIDDFSETSKVNYAKILLNEQLREFIKDYGFDYKFLSLKANYNALKESRKATKS